MAALGPSQLDVGGPQSRRAWIYLGKRYVDRKYALCAPYAYHVLGEIGFGYYTGQVGLTPRTDWSHATCRVTRNSLHSQSPRRSR